MIGRKELIKKYFDFFKSKKHKVIPNSSLVPKEDPTTLFISAGMQPLVPYLLGQKHPLGKRLVNVQKCIRTTDIEEVGDKTHHTFFEMLGNWSLGDYWKEDAIEMSLEFLTKDLKIPKKNISVSVFKGNKNVPKDTDSEKVWKSLGISKSKIKFLGEKDNWWGPAGTTGPCGPDTEMFVNDVEIWNDVFMQYNKNSMGKYERLEQRNVDTGMGVERTVALLNGLDDNYLTDSWKPIIDEIEHLSGKKYNGNEKTFRIIADHIKASVFILAEGISPSNTGQGYVLRRLIRRALVNLRKLGFAGTDLINPLTSPVFDVYSDYKELEKNRNNIYNEIKKEEEKFEKTLDKGISKFESMVKRKKSLSGKNAFLLYQSYGFPIELTEELAKDKKIKVDKKGFEKEFEKHQKLSQTAAKGRFSSGLADNSEQTTKLHTATHLLNEALRQVLGKDIKQKGSNITPERLRFDFNFSRKLTDEEIKAIEKLVNKKIKEGLKVTSEEMSLKKALDSNAQSEFGAKYPSKVSVYSIGNFSKEICTGPHVENTKEIGKFKIVKEQSSAAGIRRIRAIVE